MDATDIRKWARSFRAEAAADNYRIAVARWDLGMVGVAGESDPIQKWRARELVRDTVALVELSLAYYRVDGRDGGDALLRLQTYDPCRSEGRYLLVFELGKYRRTHLLVDELRQIDLVDLHEAIWFSYLVIQHPDESDFAAGEHEAVRRDVLRDVRYDFSEEELRLDISEFPAGVQVEFIDLP